MIAFECLRLIGAEIVREETLPADYGALESEVGITGPWYALRFDGQVYSWARSLEMLADSCAETIGWRVVAERLAPLAAEVERLRDAIDNLEVQATPGIVDGWVCVPEIEWTAAMHAARTPKE